MDEGPADLSGDAEGNWHLLFYDYALRKYKYVILSAEGSLIFEAAGDFSKGLREFGKGRIAVCESGTDGRSQRILEADISQGILLEIGNLSFNTVFIGISLNKIFIDYIGLHKKRGLYIIPNLVCLQFDRFGRFQSGFFSHYSDLGMYSISLTLYR